MTYENKLFVTLRLRRGWRIAERELASLMSRLQDITESAAVETDLFGLVHRTLQPSTIGLRIRKPAG